MNSLTLLIPIALLFSAIAVSALFWAIRSGQFDDLDRAANDILFDEDSAPKTPQKTPQNASKPDAADPSTDD